MAKENGVPLDNIPAPAKVEDDEPITVKFDSGFEFAMTSEMLEEWADGMGAIDDFFEKGAKETRLNRNDTMKAMDF